MIGGDYKVVVPYYFPFRYWVMYLDDNLWLWFVANQILVNSSTRDNYNYVFYPRLVRLVNCEIESSYNFAKWILIKDQKWQTSNLETLQDKISWVRSTPSSKIWKCWLWADMKTLGKNSSTWRIRKNVKNHNPSRLGKQNQNSELFRDICNSNQDEENRIRISEVFRDIKFCKRHDLRFQSLILTNYQGWIHSRKWNFFWA